MKTLAFLLILPVLASCEGFKQVARDAAKEELNQLDTNKNGQLDPNEIKGLNIKDPAIWLGAVNALLLALGLRSKQGQIDDLYDATHAPIAKPPATPTS